MVVNTAADSVGQAVNTAALLVEGIAPLTSNNVLCPHGYQYYGIGTATLRRGTMVRGDVLARLRVFKNSKHSIGGIGNPPRRGNNGATD